MCRHLSKLRPGGCQHHAAVCGAPESGRWLAPVREDASVWQRLNSPTMADKLQALVTQALAVGSRVVHLMAGPQHTQQQAALAATSQQVRHGKTSEAGCYLWLWDSLLRVQHLVQLCQHGIAVQACEDSPRRCLLQGRACRCLW